VLFSLWCALWCRLWYTLMPIQGINALQPERCVWYVVVHIDVNKAQSYELIILQHNCSVDKLLSDYLVIDCNELTSARQCEMGCLTRLV
jgi:hypothetical protein